MPRALRAFMKANFRFEIAASFSVASVEKVIPVTSGRFRFLGRIREFAFLKGAIYNAIDRPLCQVIFSTSLRLFRRSKLSPQRVDGLVDIFFVIRRDRTCLFVAASFIINFVRHHEGETRHHGQLFNLL